MIKVILHLLLIFLPFKLKRFFYKKLFNFEIHTSARIGMSLVMPEALYMDQYSSIGNFNVIKGVTKVTLGLSASISNLNWISGFPINTNSLHFSDQSNRVPALILGDHSAITNRHLIDCTDTVTFGRFSTFAGFRSQILTHSISIVDSRQRSGPVIIGDYTFTGTGSIILPNSFLPNFSVLGAGAVLNKKYNEEYFLYAGNPARPVKKLGCDAVYFNRKSGFVN
ncbi:MAG: acyltransferase [Burkholderiales bacterium]|nr:acyltransferase [Burkholderiales bacterium]